MRGCDARMRCATLRQNELGLAFSDMLDVVMALTRCATSPAVQGGGG